MEYAQVCMDVCTSVYGRMRKYPNPPPRARPGLSKRATGDILVSTTKLLTRLETQEFTNSTHGLVARRNFALVTFGACTKTCMSYTMSTHTHTHMPTLACPLSLGGARHPRVPSIYSPPPPPSRARTHTHTHIYISNMRTHN
jgi:hypothetical protein